jgi:cell division protein FtsI/penicillin-binding protein 2
MVSIAATLANNGTRVPLHLLEKTLDGCDTTAQPPAKMIVSPEIAAELRALWPHFEESIGHQGSALAGPERTLSWFIGLNSPKVPRYAVAVLLEHSGDQQGTPPKRAAHIGIQLLKQTVAP